jgi:hypothetical protein
MGTSGGVARGGGATGMAGEAWMGLASVEPGAATKEQHPAERVVAPPAITGVAPRAQPRVATEGHPTAPSICSSINRFSSSAYSIGSSFAIGSTNPRTIIAIASSSSSPRLIR